MCGIAGILKFDGQTVDRDLLKQMTDIIAHRGPDGEGQWFSGPVGLGHRRLSIIDLSAHASQPMLSADGQTVIVFNGEIYNYQDLTRELKDHGVHCRTTSDTEVILHLYRLFGPDCVAQLRGMFAFAIWDNVRQQLFLARDRVGIKPLYFLRSGQAFVFASEIKSVVASGFSARRVSRKALAGVMRFLVVPQPDTIFEDVHKLEPGRTLLVRPDGSVREDIYWSPPADQSVDISRSESDWVSELDQQLNESIRYHMVADVPVSAFLSGGLDSSAIVTLMRRQAPDAQLDTYSITFPGQEDFDEGPYARQVAEHNGVGYHVGTISESFMGDLRDIVWHLDEPFAISSAFATYYLARHAANSTKVVLTGDGGDELFAGYEGYKNDRYLNLPPAAGLLTAAYNVLFASMNSLKTTSPTLLRLLNGLRTRLGSEGLRYSERSAQNSLSASSAAFSADYYYGSLTAWQDNLVAHYYDELDGADRLSRKLFAEYKTRLVDEMLMKVDRMTMAHSLEARVPLLDHKVVEFAFGVPSALKLRQEGDKQVTKYLLKKSMEPYLPKNIIYRKKQGFNIPVPSWMQGGFLDQLGERVLHGRLRNAGIINPAGIRLLLDRQSAGSHNYSNMLIVLLVLETWAECYEEQLGSLSWE